MSKHSWLLLSAAIASLSFPVAAIAIPLRSPPSSATLQQGLTLTSETDVPICYAQLPGRGLIDLSHLCGNKPKNASAAVAVPVSSAPAPPVFNPEVVNASTTGQCNFVDANGKPCP
ncbi:MAG: hypothetical protein RBJ76_20135 [Stenomitos frigidus ULC029]